MREPSLFGLLVAVVGLLYAIMVMASSSDERTRSHAKWVVIVLGVVVLFTGWAAEAERM